jgi:hypothetical protein
MLKRIVIAAGFVMGLIASVVGGWTAGGGPSGNARWPRRSRYSR